MKILLTLDYELFLGERTGSVDCCLVVPMGYLSDAVKPYGAGFSIFVDATYLYRLNELRKDFKRLDSEYQKVVLHLLQLKEEGHDLQLHVHPHWHYSTYDGEKWVLDHEHYKLCDLSFEEADQVFSLSKKHLDSIIGYSTTAFRAGGFSTQPTSTLTALFQKNGIRVDSSVCWGQYYNSPQQAYDYRKAPRLDYYRFEEDINLTEEKGRFGEITISMHTISPLFYWKYVATRLFKQPHMRQWGDGLAVKATNDSILERLTKFTQGMATIDGFKCGLLENAYQIAKKEGRRIFCVIGHPKLATPYSIGKLAEFCERRKQDGDEFVTISQM